jgi:two-component system, NarL family, response regulator LiaR
MEVDVSKRILLVDDNALSRRLIRAFLESQPQIEVCGEASDGAEGLEKHIELKPDLIVLDFSMPRINGLQAAFMLHKIAPDTPIILFTLFKNEILDRLAQTAGVASVISKADEITILGDEVQRLTAGVN